MKPIPQKKPKTLVVKLGSSIIAPGGKFDQTVVNALVQDVILAQESGYNVVLISSGAIAFGMQSLGYKKRPQETHVLMALSSLGQIALMDTYAKEFAARNRRCAQMLLTWDDFEHRKRFIHIQHTLTQLFSFGVVPIINENDAVSLDEIRFGDNDRLSALVATAIHADLLVILSDVEGLLDGKVIVPQVEEITKQTFSLVKRKDSGFTSGGMVTKLQAAQMATLSGVPDVITSGSQLGVITRLVKGELVGTRFLSAKQSHRARKSWIAFGKKPKGKIYVDHGAQKALVDGGRSLLAVGITKVEGNFRVQIGRASCRERV